MIPWFAKSFTVQTGDLVAANDERVGMLCGNGVRFGLGKPKRCVFWRLAGACGFINLGLGDSERNLQAI